MRQKYRQKVTIQVTSTTELKMQKDVVVLIKKMPAANRREIRARRMNIFLSLGSAVEPTASRDS